MVNLTLGNSHSGEVTTLGPFLYVILTYDIVRVAEEQDKDYVIGAYQGRGGSPRWKLYAKNNVPDTYWTDLTISPVE